jgi:hypothetical protein
MSYKYFVKSNTDAPATNRGFLFQCLYIVNLWIDNYDNAIFYPETEDDLKVYANNTIIFAQLKSYSKLHSFANEEVLKSIYNFYIIFRENNTMKLDFYFISNSDFIDKNKDYISKTKENISQIIKLTLDYKVKELNEKYRKEIDTKTNEISELKKKGININDPKIVQKENDKKKLHDELLNVDI